MSGNRAQVVIDIPEGAKLYANGQATSLTGSKRVFLTPELAQGVKYQYTMTAVGADGKEFAKNVTVEAGKTSSIDFKTDATVMASSPVTVNLPSDAKLYVDNQVAATSGGRMTFQTPKLEVGQTYTYRFKAEINRDGKTEETTQTVSFKAGEPISVDFTGVSTSSTASK